MRLVTLLRVYFRKLFRFSLADLQEEREREGEEKREAGSGEVPFKSTS